MFQVDRLVFATTRPDEVDMILQKKRGLTLAASGRSFPGVATRIYPFPGGGFLEVTYIEDESDAVTSEGGEALLTFLKENGDGYYALILETDDLGKVKEALTADDYPVMETPVQEITDPTGQTIRFQMIGTYPHLPWFVQYDKQRESPTGFPQAAFLYTQTLAADVTILEKIFSSQATIVEFPHTTAALFPLYNASLRVEAADEYGFAYFDPAGILFGKDEHATDEDAR